MATTMREKDIELLGYTNVEQAQSLRNARWKMFTATAVAGIDEVTARFIYLNSSARTQDLTEARNQTKGLGTVHVLYAKSIELNESTIKATFPKARIFEDVLWKKLRGLFDEYLADLQRSLHFDENYVTPRVVGRSDHDIESELREFFKGSLRGAENNLLVLKASAGVGKTTLATKLASDLAKDVDRLRVIPIFIESSHWGKLHLDSIDDFWEIIQNSLSIYGSYVPISQELFFHMMEQGLIGFVFDGFDELCGRRSSQFNASDIIDDLSQVAEGSEAKVLVTTRSLYWDREVGDQSPVNLTTRELAPFSKQQAKAYFEKAFPSAAQKEERATANGIYAKLLSAITRPKEGSGRAYFVNLPLCVALISDYVKDGGKQEDVENASPQGLLRELLAQVCKRETTRQSLESDADAQLDALIELACLHPTTQNPPLSLEDDISLVFSSSDAPRIPDHPLLREADRSPETNEVWVQFKYDFLAPFLRALRASDELEAGGALSEPTIQLMKYEAGGKGFAIEHLAMLLPSIDSFDAKAMCDSLSLANSDAQSFFFHLLYEVADRELISFSRVEKTEEILIRLVGPDFSKSSKVKDRSFSGSFHQLDLRNISFENCTFKNVDFSSCVANGKTYFEKCVFKGNLDFPVSKADRVGWGEVDISSNCRVEFPASASWNSLHNVSIGSRKEEMAEVFRLALHKFWQNGRPKPNIREKDWWRGSLGASALAKDILAALVSAGVVKEIGGAGKKDVQLRFDGDSASALSKYMNNNQITGRIKIAWDSLS